MAPPGADRPAPSPIDCAVREKLTAAFDQLPREYIDLAPASSPNPNPNPNPDPDPDPNPNPNPN